MQRSGDTLEMLTKIDNYLLPTSHTGRSDESDLVAINSTLRLSALYIANSRETNHNLETQ